MIVTVRFEMDDKYFDDRGQFMLNDMGQEIERVANSIGGKLENTTKPVAALYNSERKFSISVEKTKF